MESTWDLSVLYRGFDDPEIEKDFARLKECCGQMKAVFAGDPLPALENAVDIMEEIYRLSSSLGSFAGLTLAADAACEPAQQLMDRLMVFSVQISLVSSEMTWRTTVGSMVSTTLPSSLRISLTMWGSIR